MNAKRLRTKPHTKLTRGPRGKTGKAGRTGAVGPAGPSGKDQTVAVAVLTEHVAQLVKELRTQLVRIAQIQLQLDLLTKGEEAMRRDRGATDRTPN